MPLKAYLNTGNKINLLSDSQLLLWAGLRATALRFRRGDTDVTLST